MAEGYPSYQVFSFAILLALAFYGTTAMLEALSHHESYGAPQALFTVLLALVWISAPLTLRGVRWAYLLALIIVVVASVGIVVSPASPFKRPSELYLYSFLLNYIFIAVGLYVLYKGYKSLSPSL